MIFFEDMDESLHYECDFLGNRKTYADTLTQFIDMVDDGCVLAIDAPWGEGKTTFINWWAKDLATSHSVILFNAFKSDFMCEPFWALTKTLFDAFLYCKDDKKDLILFQTNYN